MEGEKERLWQQREEKESNEAEDDRRSDEDPDHNEDEDEEGAALVWQEGYAEDELGLPIMHWEALSLRIAELEKQEEEKKKNRDKVTTLEGLSLDTLGSAAVSRAEERGGRRSESWEDGDDACNSHVLALTSRLQTQMNLQLCFINNSESEDEDEVEKKEEDSKRETSSSWLKKGSAQAQKNSPSASKPEKAKSRGFRNTLRNLRDRLRADHKTLSAASSESVIQRKHLELSDLQTVGIKELIALRSSLSQTIQDLSSELVGRLQVRDQLRTEQDAMLLEVQDLTSL